MPLNEIDVIVDVCLLGEMNFPPIESAGGEETWYTCLSILEAILVLLIASCHLHIAAKYPVF